MKKLLFLLLFLTTPLYAADQWYPTGTPTTNSDDITFATELTIGGTAGNSISGWIDEFRWSKGIARWTANFTPPTGAYT